MNAGLGRGTNNSELPLRPSEPIFFGTNERPSEANVPRIYGKEGGGDPAHSAGQAQTQVIVFHVIYIGYSKY